MVLWQGCFCTVARPNAFRQAMPTPPGALGAAIHDARTGTTAMPTHRAKPALVLPLLITLIGCSTISGRPQSPLEFSTGKTDANDAEALINKYSQDFAKHATEDGIDTDEKRNALISKALTIMDYRYAEFISDTETGRKNKEMLTDVVELSMNLAGTAVGAAGTKTILAAISAGVNGIGGAIDKNYFYEKTFPSLVAQMNADRKKAMVYIIKGTTLPLREYPWPQAVHDLIEYYNAGTLLGAISSIQKEAGKQQDDAETKIMEIRKVSFGVRDVPALEWLKAYLSPAGMPDKTREKHLTEACIKPSPLWKENRSASRLTEFLYSQKWEALRTACKKQLEAPR